jgi:AcrR family transcriptional regulator
MARHKTSEKEAAILRAASVVFAARDYHEVLMEDVAAEAKVGKGTLYRYFPTKDELFFATIFAGLDELRAELGATAERGGRLRDVLEALAVGTLRFYWPRRPLLTLMHRYEARLRDPQGGEWLERRNAIADLIAKVFRRAAERGEARNVKPRLAAELFLGMVRAANVYRTDRDTPEALGADVVSILLDGVSLESAGRETRRHAIKLAR